MKTPRFPSLLLFTLAALATFGAPLRGAPPAERAAWMRGARWGVMGYYLSDLVSGDQPMTVDRWNELVDHYDVKALAAQLHHLGAGYYLLSVGQASGYYVAPNPAYDRWVGTTPSRCSRRDLISDLADALAERQIKLLVYLPAIPPVRDPAAVKGLHYVKGPDRNAEFQKRWESVIRSWSERWGTKVAGWWFESCNYPNLMYRQPEAPNFTSFAAAARAGNPASALAFNPGVVNRTLSITPEDDYNAGEIVLLERWEPNRLYDGKIDGAQVHVYAGLGAGHGKGPLRFTPQQAAAFSRKVAKVGGVITWDAPVMPDGTIAAEYLAPLEAVGQALAK